MAKKNTQFQKLLKSLGLLSGSGGVVGLILALSGVCLPCVLIPLGFVGAWLLFVFSFLSVYKWWFLWWSLMLLLFALSIKRTTVCKNWVCKIDKKHTSKISLSLTHLRSNLSKLHNWKTYVAIPIVLLVVALVYTLSLSREKSGELDYTWLSFSQADSSLYMTEILPTKWPYDAKIIIVEYSDYFCPACLPFYEDVLHPILDIYKDNVSFTSIQVNVLMDLGYSSTHAAYCAHEQGKYWEMHEKLLQRMNPFVDREKSWDLFNDMLETSKAWTSRYFTTMAEEIDWIDAQQFFACMKSNIYLQKIERTTAAFQKLGFSGVPVLLINGKYFSGFPTQENLRSVIDTILQE